MPFYKVNRSPQALSARHPFHGFGNMVQGAAQKAPVIQSPEGTHYEQEGIDPFDFDYRMVDRRYYYTVQGYGGVAEVWDESKPSLLKGLLAGVVAYGVARAVGGGAPLATKLGIVMGVLEAGVGIATTQLISGATETPEASQPAVAAVAKPDNPAGTVKVTE